MGVSEVDQRLTISINWHRGSCRSGRSHQIVSTRAPSAASARSPSMRRSVERVRCRRWVATMMVTFAALLPDRPTWRRGPGFRRQGVVQGARRAGSGQGSRRAEAARLCPIVHPEATSTIGSASAVVNGRGFDQNVRAAVIEELRRFDAGHLRGQRDASNEDQIPASAHSIGSLYAGLRRRPMMTQSCRETLRWWRSDQWRGGRRPRGELTGRRKYPRDLGDLQVQSLRRTFQQRECLFSSTR